MRLTDLELCKRIAEIEGLIFCDGGKYFRCEILKNGKVIGYYQYNPLIIKALLFDLMVKYRISIEWLESSRFVIGAVCVKNDNSSGIDFDSDKEIPRAILECIVEANK